MRKIPVFITCIALIFVFSVQQLGAVTMGDTNKDNQISLDEAMKVFLYVAGKGELSFSEKAYSDIDNNGRIGICDAMKIFLAVAGKGELPQQQKWIQDKFIISTFFSGASVDKEYMKKTLALTKEAGFNLIENGWLRTEEAAVAVEAAEEVGIDTLIQELEVFSGFQNILTAEPNEEAIKKYCQKYADYKHLVGYFLWDEPIKENFNALKGISDIFSKYSKTSLKYSCILPSYGQYKWDDYPSYVDSYIKEVDPDVLCVDYYPYVFLEDISYSDMWRDVGYLRKKSIETNKPFWFYFQALGNDLEKRPGGITIEKIKTQCYGLLCYGADGISYYTSEGNVVYNGDKAPMFEEIKAFNAEISSLGNFLLSKNNEAVFHSNLSNRYAKIFFSNTFETSSLIESATMPRSLIGQFGENSTSTKYLLISNKSQKNTSEGTITFRHPVKISTLNTLTNEKTLINERTSSLDILQQPAQATLYVIE